MNSRLLITLLCAGAVALACGSLARTDASPARGSQAQEHHARVATTEQAVVNTAFAVKVEPHQLRFALDLTNASKKKVELAFPSGQEYDFAVLDSTGREVYRWGSTRMFTQAITNKLLDGGDTIRISESANTTLPRGRYVAVATLHSSNYPVTQRSSFELR